MHVGVVSAFLVKIALWSVLAFWLWLSLLCLFQPLRLPLAAAVAAAVSWIGVGLALPRLLGLLASRGDVWFHLSHRFLSMH